MPLSLVPNTPSPFLTIPNPAKPNPYRSPKLKITTHAEVPARDKVIEFGKYKGRMLGTLPSTYLRWVSSNLRARDFEEWAKLADQVLEDPVYNDRVEWEFAEKLLHGNTFGSKVKVDGAVSELLEISQRFGWDYEDKVGWSKVDFQLLGTSRGGRIPRAKEKEEGEVAETKVVENAGGNGKRGVRRERSKARRRMHDMNGASFECRNVVESEEGVGVSKSGGENDTTNKVYNRFPGRESLLRKALIRRTRF